jgi:ATP-binding cassette subfamily B protein
MESARGSKLRLLPRLFHEWRAFVPQWLLLLGLNLLSIPVALLLPYPLKMAVDQGANVILWACGLEFGLIVFKSLMEHGIWAYQFHVSEKIIAAERTRLFGHLQRLPIQFLDRRGSAALFYNLQNDVSSMMSLVTHGLIPFVTTATLYLSMVTVAWRLDFQLTLLALGALPLTWMISSRHLPRSRTYWAKVRDADQGSLGVLQEVLGASRMVRAFVQEDSESARFGMRARAKLKALNHAVANEIFFGVLIALIVAAASAATLYLGLLHVRDGRLSLGGLFVIITYLAQLLRPLETLSKQISGIQTALVSAEKILEIQNSRPDPVSPENPVRIARAKGEIEFQSVGFSYGDGRRVLDGFNLRVQPGMRVGIVGPTGIGKSTVLGLLLRFFDPGEGRVLLDGVDIRTMDLADLRRQFAVVPQEPAVFMGTVRDAIAYGRPDASDAEIVQAARLAEAHDFIARLPNGYLTRLEDRGVNLSGGEKQRIAIARAFLMDVPVLLLDEPSNHLDDLRERALAKALLRQGKTVITVSHSPEFLAGYDLIVNIGLLEPRPGHPADRSLLAPDL